jgi:diguanylate cyclase (GGDEF)-like protein
LDRIDYLPDRALHNLALLLVEDCEDEACLLLAELASKGVRTDHLRVDNAADMRRALAGRDWDLVISDHCMPGFDSLGALDVLNESGKDLPFIIYSGNIPEHQALSAMGKGVGDYVAKGRVDRLLPVILRELKGAAARRAAREAGSRIEELAHYDALTDLPNHTLFCTRVADWLARPGCSGAILTLDLDRFMRINASFGYEAGNRVLRLVGRRLAECIEANVVLARLGGDRFGFLVQGLTSRESAHTLAQWVLRAFDAPFVLDGLELFLTPSIGLAMFPEDGAEVYELLANAETAMAFVKQGGGHNARFYRREMNESAAERVVLETELRHAMERGEFFLEYQPCVDAAGRTVSVEALVRWRHPVHGVMPPDRFIPLADESGLIVDIGAWVLREACRQGRAWHDLGHPELSVSVNVSAVQFGQPRLLHAVYDALSESGFPAQCLILELTESVLMRDAESTISMLRSLKNLGVKIAMDDFGTGYSSLSYLKRFPIDIVKIDRSFVRELPGDEEDVAIVRAIKALARSLHLSVIAEGVETPEQLSFLQTERCERFQGFLLSRPLEPERLADFLTRQERARQHMLH